MYAIKCIENPVRKYVGWYLAKPGSENTYTPKLENARIFSRKDKARIEKNDSEIVVSVLWEP